MFQIGDKVKLTVELNNCRAQFDAVVGLEHTFGWKAKELHFHTSCMAFKLDAPCIKAIERRP